MNDLLGFWTRMSMARRAVLLGATLGVFAAILGLSRLGASQDQSLLYAGLDAQAAGQVIAALDQSATTYEVRGDAIYVPSAQRDAIRMHLAGQGLPASGGQGYELLDGLSGFGTTSQMFDAAYWRAKEGELARTALAMPNVRMARVHIASPQGGAFQRGQDISASITVMMRSGTVTVEQADALRHLIASAVGRMPADRVTVIDSTAGLIPAKSGLLGGDAAESKALEVKRNVERLLEARVGPGKAIVEVSVDLVREREAITERKIDPQGRVAISADNETRSESSTQPAGAVTVASNLPTGDAAQGSDGRSQSSSSRERMNFDVSETQREIIREPGSIRRMTIAVLVDGTVVQQPDGTLAREQRTADELADLRELVSAAAGIDEARGDALTLKSMEFQADAEEGTVVEAGLFSAAGPIDVMTILQLGGLVLVALVLALFVVRPLLLQGRRADAGGVQHAPGTAALPPPAAGSETALTGEIADDDENGFSIASARSLTPDAVDDRDPMVRLKRLIDSRQQESVEILRGWLEQQEERG